MNVDMKDFCDRLREQLDEEDLKYDMSEGKLAFGFTSGPARTLTLIGTSTPIIDTLIILYDAREGVEPPTMEADTYMRCLELCNLINMRSDGRGLCYIPDDGKQIAIFRTRVTEEVIAEAADKGGPLAVLMSVMKNGLEHFPAFARLIKDDSATARKAMENLKFDNFMMSLMQYSKQRQEAQEKGENGE